MKCECESTGGGAVRVGAGRPACAASSWIGLDWIGLDRIGSDRIGYDKDRLLDRIGEGDVYRMRQSRAGGRAKETGPNREGRGGREERR